MMQFWRNFQERSASNDLKIKVGKKINQDLDIGSRLIELHAPETVEESLPLKRIDTKVSAKKMTDCSANSTTGRIVGSWLKRRAGA